MPNETKAEPRTLPLRWGAALHVHGVESEEFITVSVDNFGQRRDLGGAPLDVVVRFLAPECGFIVTDDASGTRYRTEGPICIGGPYDGRRLPKVAAPRGRLRVPLYDPPAFHTRELPPWDSLVSYREGQYILTPLQMGYGPSHVSAIREVWWWEGPR